MPHSLRTFWPLVVSGLLACGVAVATIGVQLLETPQVPARAAPETPPARPAVAADATTTPTPRVIDVPGTATVPAPAPASTETSAPAEDVPLPAAATRAPRQAATPPPTASETSVISLESPSTTPLPTAIALPTVMVAPATTATRPTPSPTTTPTPKAKPDAVPLHEFAAAEWSGGFYRGDGQAYGRPWVAVYGALSAYPHASLVFTLDTAPDGPATLTVAGLDDEWAARNEIVLDINGETVFTGAAPFADWDGVGNGADADWTTVAFPIPEGVLRAGTNEIAIANLTPSGNFNAPPYILLAETSLAIGEPNPIPTISPSSRTQNDRGTNGDSRQSRGHTARQRGEARVSKAHNAKGNKVKTKKPKKAKHQHKKAKGKQKRK